MSLMGHPQTQRNNAMILLRTSRFQTIALPDNDWSIYISDYYSDEQGRIYQDFHLGGLFHKGNLIIETPSFRYVFWDVDDPFHIVPQLLDQIEARAGEKVACIDMEKLGNLMGFMATKLEIHSKNCSGPPVVIVHPEL